MKELTIRQYHIELFGEEDDRVKPVVYLHTFPAAGGKIWGMTKKNFVLAAISGFDWNGDLSPWKADSVFGGEGDFAGNGGQYLQTLTEELVPLVERELPFVVKERGVAGYSMAGLFAAYAVHKTDLFDRMASVSGSLWFDGFCQYALTHDIVSEKMKIYLSLGSKEHCVRNSRMAAVKECTETLADHWRIRFPVVYETNPGGHFNKPEQRVAEGLDRLIEE